MKKRFVSVILVVCLLLSMMLCTGCQSKSEPKAEQEAPKTETAAPEAAAPEAAAPEAAAPEAAAPETAEKKDPVNISFAGATAGGAFYMGATAFSSVVSANSDYITVTVESSGASGAIADLVQMGEVSMGMNVTDVAWEAYNGKATFEDRGAYDNLRAFIITWPAAFTFNVLEESDVYTFEDLAGKTIFPATANSSADIYMRRVCDYYGISDDVRIVNTTVTDGQQQTLDGLGAGWCQGHPASSLTEAEASHNMRVLTLPEEDAEAFTELYPMYSWSEDAIPAGYYKCLPDGIGGLTYYNMIICSKDMDEDLVYDMIKTLVENNPMVRDIYTAFADGIDNLENYANLATIPYHPGVVKYFQEIGIELDPALIPQS